MSYNFKNYTLTNKSNEKELNSYQIFDKETGLMRIPESTKLNVVHSANSLLNQQTSSYPKGFLNATSTTNIYSVINSGKSLMNNNNSNLIPSFNIRFAVNGLSKFASNNDIPSINKNIQMGNFGDDSGMVAENSKCIVLGIWFLLFILK